MKTSDLLRVAVVLATLGYLFGSEGGVTPPAPYSGSLTALHQAGKSMESGDRSAMSDGFSAGADMVRADTRGLIKDTTTAQNFLLALLEFNYNGVGKPSAKYPAVSKEVEKVFTATLGDEVKPMTASDRGKLADALEEMGRSLR